eukprot:TRINITY_DN4834_c0_g1_i3.p1 TRINITY_DN4834_c0_g1~~TRINITY_DN4834_c0_g1_i3.p1  ORF type:complete len:270 (-),score=20.30 TRINITY_DN4834_c0_g1_i3:173-982(-)
MNFIKSSRLLLCNTPYSIRLPFARTYSSVPLAPAKKSFIPSKKVALVIGNDDYTIIPQLQSCVKDAKDVHSQLKSIGFEAELLTNANLRETKSALLRIADKRVPNDICLIYYSGHGIEYSGRGYLMGTSKGSYKDAMLIGMLLTTVCTQADNGKTVFISDSCRTPTRPAPPLREGEEGIITAVPPHVSQFHLEFATSPNDIAWDGESANHNSLFTSYLLPLLTRRDLDLNSLFTVVRKNMEDAGIEQRPWTHHCMTTSVCLAADIQKLE